jgi:GDP-4-dehydro-6-deoxy-D-mannose reductase
LRVLVTGAHGFVGRWLTAELAAAGHEVVAFGHTELDVTDRAAVERCLEKTRPSAIAHLAAVSFAPDAREDPGKALATTVGGTVNLLDPAGRLQHAPAVLVAGSSEVYGAPVADDLPLGEDAPLRPSTPYAWTKISQEGIALALAARHHLPLVATRSFNHLGPGQRPVFVLPALAQRIVAYSAGQAADIPVGNIDVRRDFTDVRDVARAYRLLLEGLTDGRIRPGGLVVNVASGRSVAIRELLEHLWALAGVNAPLRVDPALVRPNDPAEIRGIATLLRELTGWEPLVPLETTLADVWRAYAQG